jgi:hypothetical protein
MSKLDDWRSELETEAGRRGFLDICRRLAAEICGAGSQHARLAACSRVFTRVERAYADPGLTAEERAAALSLWDQGIRQCCAEWDRAFGAMQQQGMGRQVTLEEPDTK